MEIEKHHPAAHASVVLTAEGGKIRHEEWCDAQGRFAFPSVQPGAYDLHITVEHGGKKVGLRRENLVLEGGQTVHVKRTGLFGEEIGGKLSDAKGRPLAGHMVHATWKSAEGEWEAWGQAASDQTGHYRMAGPFRKLSYVGINSSGIPQTAPQYDVEAGRMDVDFRLGDKPKSACGADCPCGCGN